MSTQIYITHPILLLIYVTLITWYMKDSLVEESPLLVRASQFFICPPKVYFTVFFLSISCKQDLYRSYDIKNTKGFIG